MLDFWKTEVLFKPVKDWAVNSGSTPVAELDGKTYNIDSAEALCSFRAAARRYVNLGFIAQGVDIVDIDSVHIHPSTVIGAGTIVYPNTVIREDVTIGNGCSIGPFAYLRPGSRIGNHVKLGDFVEIKNSTIGDKTSVSHLTYVGDADVGGRVNFGCGTVTVNYDGAGKHRTTVKDGAFIGCNTNLVAPVTVGANAYTAAGSTITEDVPENSLAIARERQTNKLNWRLRRINK